MDNNHRGCLAEYLFAVECMKRGYQVSMPLLDSSIYDCIVDVNGDLKKVQIKSTAKQPNTQRKTVHLVLHNAKGLYTVDKVDFFAVWVSYYQGFFIFKNTGSMRSIRLSPDGKHKKKFNNFAFD